MIYATDGEIVSCASGHELYQLVEDIGSFDMVQGSMFRVIHPAAPPLDNTNPFPPCAVCGEPFCSRPAGGGTLLHFDDGWRHVA